MSLMTTELAIVARWLSGLQAALEFTLCHLFAVCLRHITYPVESQCPH